LAYTITINGTNADPQIDEDAVSLAQAFVQGQLQGVTSASGVAPSGTYDLTLPPGSLPVADSSGPRSVIVDNTPGMTSAF
jgi:hypothetical protein